MIKLNLILSYVIDTYNKSKETNMLFGPYMKMLSHAYKFESKGQRSQPIKAFQDQKLFIPLELFFALYGLKAVTEPRILLRTGKFFFPKILCRSEPILFLGKIFSIYFAGAIAPTDPFLVPSLLERVYLCTGFYFSDSWWTIGLNGPQEFRTFGPLNVQDLSEKSECPTFFYLF